MYFFTPHIIKSQNLLPQGAVMAIGFEVVEEGYTKSRTIGKARSGAIISLAGQMKPS